MSTLEKEPQSPGIIAPTVRAIYNLGPVERIPPGEGRTFHAGNRTVVVFRSRDGNVYATQPDCPHRGGPLADGLVGPAKVICPLHSFAFNLATGQAIENACHALQTYPTSLSDIGDILVTIDS